MTKKRSLLIVLLGLVMALCLSFAVACKDKSTKYKVTWDIDEHASVQVEGYKELPDEVPAGTIEFTVTMDDGWEATVKAGRMAVNANADGVYSYNVTGDIDFSVTSSKIVSSVVVTTPPTNLTYYAGEELDKEGMVVTVNYATGDHETVTNYSVNYATAGATAFSLGDESFTVSYGGKTSEPVALAQKVVGLVTLNPNGGTIDAAYVATLEANNELANVKTTNGVVTFTFAAALENEVKLPTKDQISRGEVAGDYTFVNWTGGASAVAKDTAVSQTYTANWNAKLLELTKIYYENREVEGDTIPYLVVEGTFKAAKTAYLYLYEGNDKVELNGPTIGDENTERGDEFELLFNMRDLANARTESGANYLGKHMDIKFVAEADGVRDVQEIALEDYKEVEGFVDLDNNVVDSNEDYIYGFRTYSPADGITNLKAVVERYLFLEYDMEGSQNEDGDALLTISGKVGAGYAGNTLQLDWWVASSVVQTCVIGEDGSWSVTFNLMGSEWPVNTMAYAHLSIRGTDGADLWPGDGSEWNLPTSGYVTNEWADHGAHGDVTGRTIVVESADYTKVFYVGEASWGAIVAYGVNERESITADSEIELKVDNYENPTKLYYVVRYDVGGRIGYTVDFVKALVLGNTDGGINVFTSDNDRFTVVDEVEQIYEVWYDVTSYAGNQLWPNVYVVSGEGDNLVYTKLLEVGGDTDNSTNGLYAIINIDGVQKKFEIKCDSSTWNRPCLVPGTIADGETNPPEVNPDYVPPQKSYTVDMTTAKFEVVDGKPIVSVSGTVDGYTESEITFDLQNTSNWGYVRDLDVTVTINANGAFTLVADLSKAPAANGYILHINFGSNVFDVEFKGDGVEDGVVLGTCEGEYKTWTLAITSMWDRHMVTLAVTDTRDSITVVAVSVSLTEGTGDEAGKAFFTISGTYTADGYAENEIYDFINAYHYDFQVNADGAFGPAIDNAWSRVTNLAKVVTINEDGTYSVRLNITDLWNGATMSNYTTHFGGESANLNPTDDSCNGQEITVGNKTYKLVYIPGSSNGGEFWGAVGLTITEA